MKKLISILLFVLVIACAVSAYEFYMGDVKFNDVEKVIVASRNKGNFFFEETLLKPDRNGTYQNYLYQYIVVRSNGKVFSTFSDQFITDAPIVFGTHISKSEKENISKINSLLHVSQVGKAHFY